MLNFDRTELTYDPYPIAYSAAVLDPATYAELSASWPDTALFLHRPDLGNKYALSKLNNADNYRTFIAGHPSWQRFLAGVESPAFIEGVIAMLKRRHVDLGLAVGRPGLKDLARWLLRGRLSGPTPLSARFEFSMMPAAGGSILPHTDAPNKLITLVLSMNRPGEWRPEWGGGTSTLKPRDPRDTYNQLNRWLTFDAVDTLHTFAFEPNQCVTFVKTFNSLHCVHPMTGPEGALRKTLTINIEYPA